MKSRGAVLGAILLLTLARDASAQRPFRDPQFAVKRTNAIVYGQGEVQLPSPGFVNLLLDLYEPIVAPGLLEQRPGFIVIHGGGFTGGSRQMSDLVQLCNEMAARGYVCISIDYRLAGSQPVISSEFQQFFQEIGGGDTARNIAAAVEDGVKAYRWLVAGAASLKLDVSRIALGGGSAGSVTSLFMAYSIDDHGVTDLPDIRVLMDLWGGLYGAVGNMEAGEPPLIIVHGEQDQTVPFTEAQALVSRATAVGIPYEFHPIPNAGHGFGQIPIFTLEIEPGVTVFDRIVEFFFVQLDLQALAGEPVPVLGFGGAGLILALVLAGAVLARGRSHRCPVSSRGSCDRSWSARRRRG